MFILIGCCGKKIKLYRFRQEDYILQGGGDERQLIQNCYASLQIKTNAGFHCRLPVLEGLL
jgi:hypothetical protein